MDVLKTEIISILDGAGKKKRKMAYDDVHSWYTSLSIDVCALVSIW